MADAFGDDLFNVFDEDATSSRPVPTLEVEENVDKEEDKIKTDDSQR